MNELMVIGADLLLRSVLICAAAALLATGATTEGRLWLWRFAVVALLLLPLARVAGPDWSIPLWPALEATDDLFSGSRPHPPLPTDTDETSAAVPAFSTGLRWLGLVYLLVAGVLAARLLVQLHALSGLRRRSTLLRFQATGRRQVAVCLSTDISSPVSFGWWRPTVLLPYDWPQQAAEHVEHALEHELCHLRHHDWLWLIATRLAVANYWLNPLTWWGARRHLLDTELARDRQVLERGAGAAAYARTLLFAAGADPTRPAAMPAATLAMAGATAPAGAWNERICALFQKEPCPMNDANPFLRRGLLVVLALPLVACQVSRAQDAVSAPDPAPAAIAAASPMPNPQAAPAPSAVPAAAAMASPAPRPAPEPLAPATPPAPGIAAPRAPEPVLAPKAGVVERAEAQRTRGEALRTETSQRQQRARELREKALAETHRAQAQVQRERARVQREEARLLRDQVRAKRAQAQYQAEQANQLTQASATIQRLEARIKQLESELAQQQASRR